MYIYINIIYDNTYYNLGPKLSEIHRLTNLSYMI